MGPKGLYTVPRHHTYRGQPQLATFNSNDFDEPEPVTAKPDEKKDHDVRERDAEHATKKEKERDKRNKEHRQSEGNAKNATSDEAVTVPAGKARDNVSDEYIKPVNAVSSNIKTKRSKKNKKQEQVRPLSHSTPRKRKRDSEMNNTTLSSAHVDIDHYLGPSFGAGDEMVKNLETALYGVGAHFIPNLNEPEKKKSKKKKKSEKRETTDEAHEPDKERSDKKKKKRKADERDDSAERRVAEGIRNSVDMSYVQSKVSPNHPPQPPVIQVGSNSKQKERKSGTDAKAIISSNLHLYKQSPVPLPPPSSSSSFSAMREAYQAKAKEAISKPEVIVPETPPSIAPKKNSTSMRAPIPFPTLSDTKLRKSPELSSRDHVTQEQPPSRSIVKAPSSASAPAAALKQVQAILIPPEVASRKKVTQPLTNEPKPKLRRRLSRASSTTSTSSSGTSLSIPDMFNRVGMPYARSGASIDPFVTSKPQKPKPREIDNEASMAVFNEKFGDLQQCMDYDTEQEYLSEYLDFQSENDSEYPFPCLGSGSGCTPKKEEILRLSREEKVNVLKAMGATSNDDDALRDAVERAHHAEEFLKLAIRANVPVPTGKIEGLWTLYCPTYSKHHFDRYGYGMRTLTISSIAGFSPSSNSFVARLSIPPRSMTYSILTFSVPPHASFRAITIKTAAEGYKMDAIFLGNGYLQLRVDLNLLLRGKPTEMLGGKKVYMEFLGIHEKATEWVEKKDELEEVVKKLFRKYGSMDDV